MVDDNQTAYHQAALIAFLRSLVEKLENNSPLPFELPSNSWTHSAAGAIPGVWEDKQPYSYPVLDSWKRPMRKWVFPKAGGMIPAHTHPFAHDSVIVSGTVVVTGDREGRNGIPLTADDVVFFDAGVEHSIRALTDGAIVIHTYPPGSDGDGD